jgi:hypothetical protein
MAKRKKKSGGKFAERLADMEDQWESGKDNAAGIEDGVYSFQLQGAELKESSNGNMMVNWEHLIIDGEYEGNTVYDNSVMSNSRSFYFLAQRIRGLGYDAPEHIEEIEELIEEIVADAPVYNASVKVNKESGFCNLNNLELIDGAPEAKDEDEDEVEDEEDVEVEEEEEVEEDEEKDEEDEEDDDDSKLEELKEFCVAQGFEFEDDDIAEEDIVEALSEEKWNAKDLTAEEVKLLEGYGVKVTKAEKKKKAAKKK